MYTALSFYDVLKIERHLRLLLDHYNYNPTELAKIRSVNPAKDQLKL